MKYNLRKTFIILAGTLVILSALTASVLLQDAPEWCVSPDGSPVGCAEIALSSETAVGDFYLGDALLAQGQNPGRLVLAAGTSHTIDVRNVQDTVEGFGTLFVYQDATASVYVGEGQFRQSTVTLKKQYIRGTLNVSCDVKSYVEGESIGCQVLIDGAGQEGTLMPGGSADYILDPGDHTVVVQLVGDLAGLWSPASAEQVVNITAGQTKKVAPRFEKAGHLIVTLDQPGVVGDFYLNGELVASQVPSFEQWVQPNKSHKLEVKNLFDPAANGIYTWKDATTTAYLSPGQEKAVEVRLQQQYLKGFLDVTCDVRAYNPGESVGCRVFIDEAQQGDLAPEATANYVLDPGSHTVRVDLFGDLATLWAPPTQDKAVTISAGRTAAYAPRFDKAGHLIVTLGESTSAVGDFYINGEQVASQVYSIDRWVTPNALQKIEVKNINDPGLAAEGKAWKDAVSSTSVGSSQERTVELRLQSEYVKGFLDATCDIQGALPWDNIYCEMYVDGAFVGTIGANQTKTFMLDPGTHTVSFDIGPQHAWLADPDVFNNVAITAGQTRRITTWWQVV